MPVNSAGFYLSCAKTVHLARLSPLYWHSGDGSGHRTYQSREPMRRKRTLEPLASRSVSFKGQVFLMRSPWNWHHSQVALWVVFPSMRLVSLVKTNPSRVGNKGLPLYAKYVIEWHCCRFILEIGIDWQSLEVAWHPNSCKIDKTLITEKVEAIFSMRFFKRHSQSVVNRMKTLAFMREGVKNLCLPKPRWVHT